ncbi:MAG: glutamine-synthetase adenylyltransferase [Rhodobacteraceae bacterium]|nr:glutamine-synthetase adenylyltransferase [Paracoccaceae bacterium]
MSLSTAISRAPLPFERDFAAEAAEAFSAAPGPLRDLVAGTAGCSPYLRRLLERHGDWLRDGLDLSADDLMARILADVAIDRPVAELKPALRQAKARGALLIALADLGGIWPLERVTAALTDLADACVSRAFTALVAQDIARGKIPGAGPQDAQDAAGLFVLAMGKMGAHELNYSSDIDLIVLFDETRHAPGDFDEVRARLIRVTRGAAALLSDITADGYVFRTDLRLRPDPSVTPVCISTEAAERYYESFGRTWERAAFIKARPCAGSVAAGWRFLDALRPFVWRRHLDFAAIQDAHDMRLRIREHKGLFGALSLPGHDMKLGRGGIREIEFFTQTRQLIAGGRDPELRGRGTLEGLAALAAKGWVPPDVAASLTAAYRTHREVEHRLQMLNDAQTHALPGSDEGFARLAAFCGEADVATFREGLAARLEKVHRLTEPFFAGPAETQAAPAAEPLTAAQRALIDGWQKRPALRSERARTIFRRIVPQILARLERAADREAAARAFDGFLGGLPAGVQLFSLFEANPQLIELVVDICATAPRLAGHLARNSAVLDAVIGGDFFAPLPGVAPMAADLAEVLLREADYERQLDAARRWKKEQHFRIGVLHLRGLIGADEAARAYADLAEAVLRGLWGPVVAQFATRHGPPPGAGAAVVAMGSLGAQGLTATSDLDMIVIYDAPTDAVSEGRRPLSAPVWYARLTQALVTALSSPTAEGRLYEVDMRLRPSGNQGPVATSLAAFRGYQLEEAWTWEHLALTRARALAGEAGLCQRFEAARREILAEVGARDRVVAGAADMRARLEEAGDPVRNADPWEIKQGPGRLLELDLVIQAGALIAGSPARSRTGQLAAGRASGWMSPEDAALLARAQACMRSVQQVARLVSEGALRPDEAGQGARDFLMRETGTDSIDALAARLEVIRAEAAEVVSRLLSGPPASQPS